MAAPHPQHSAWNTRAEGGGWESPEPGLQVGAARGLRVVCSMAATAAMGHSRHLSSVVVVEGRLRPPRSAHVPSQTLLQAHVCCWRCLRSVAPSVSLLPFCVQMCKSSGRSRLCVLAGFPFFVTCAPPQDALVWASPSQLLLWAGRAAAEAVAGAQEAMAQRGPGG